ncbi:MAG: hypothetical protein M1475_01345 [Actinobacteria bacterium]|nr:hypothetical protein [Actinomycetota bacterium]
MKNNMDLFKNIIPFLNPFGVIAFLVSGIFISLFFGLSKRNQIKIFIFVLVQILLAGAFFINIYSYNIYGEFSSNLFTSGIFETAATGFILLSAIISFAVIFICNRKNDNFIKTVMIFLFAVISSVIIIISKNFTSFFIGTGCFLTAFFALTTLLNEDLVTIYNENTVKGRDLIIQRNISAAIIRFFIVCLLFLILLFFGFSILYGATDVKNFLQLFENIQSGGINIIFSLIIISISFYIYFGIFPFQAPYIGFVNKTEISSLYVLWFLYFPAGILSILKFTPIILILNKNLKAGEYILYVLLVTIFISSVCSAIAGFKTKSLRKTLGYLFTLLLSGYFVNLLMLLNGFIKEDNLNWLNIFNLAYFAVCFLPVVFIFSFIENAVKKDHVNNLKSLFYKNKIVGIFLIIIIFSLIGVPGFFSYPARKYYFDTIIDILNSKTGSLTVLNGWLVMTIIIIYMISIAAVSIRLLIILFLKEKKENDIQDKLDFPKAFYVLLGVFAAFILFSGIIGLLETLNPAVSLFGSRITDSAIFIKNLK